MTLQTTGTISLLDISTEFGGTAPHSLSEYYGRAGVPSSGTISIGNFYGKSNAVTINLTIAASTTNYNLKTALIAAGWNQVTPVICTCTINAGVTVYSTSTGSYAWQTGTGYPAGSSLSLINNGIIVGRGGNGGAGGNTGVAGAAGGGAGPALLASVPISITNNNRIAGGGGGGGGGGAAS